MLLENSGKECAGLGIFTEEGGRAKRSKTEANKKSVGSYQPEKSHKWHRVSAVGKTVLKRGTDRRALNRDDRGLSLRINAERTSIS